MSRNEANTRKDLIDRALKTAGWNLDDSNQVGIEIPVDGYNAAPWNGVGFGEFLLVASTADGDTGTVESGYCGFGKSDEESA